MRLRTLVFVAISLAVLVGGLWYWRKSEQTAARRAEAWDEEQRILATEAVLDRRFEWPHKTIPLADFAEAIADTSGLAVDLNEGAIAAEHERLTNIWISIPGGTLSVGAVLRLCLEPHELCYDIDDQRLVVTTPDASRDRTRLKSVVYPLPQPTGAPRHEEEWQELVATTIEPEDWDEVGGRGHIEPVPGGLVVTHTADVQRQVRRLLAAMTRLDEDAPRSVALSTATSLEQAERDRILAALDKAASLDCTALPLDELFRDLSITYEIPIYLDSVRMAKANTYASHPLTRRIASTTLRGLLDDLCEYSDVEYTIRDGVLIVTAEDMVEVNSHIAYSVEDLAAEDGQADLDGLIDLITTCIAVDRWSDVGGPGSIQSWGDRWLLVSQNERTQDQLAKLLGQLRRVLAADGDATVLPIAPPSAADLRVETALHQPVRLRWLQTPLITVREDLAAKLNVPVTLHGRRLDEAGVSLTTSVTCDFPTLPAHQALDQLLEQLSLAYVVQSGQVLITTRDYAENYAQSVRLYDVRPLIDPDLGLLTSSGLPQLLRDLINLESWDEVGGPGSIDTYRGVLVVSQSDQNHRWLAGFLAALEKHCLRAPSGGGDGPWFVRSESNSAEERIEQLLATPISVDFCGEPLLRALKQLTSQHEIPLIIEGECQAALDDLDAVFTMSTKHYTLGGTLDRMLECDSHLEYYVLGGSLVVALRDPLPVEVRLYRVDDLLSKSVNLLEELTASLDPTLWHESGGHCVLRRLSSRWVAVAADRVSHEEIEDWLSERRTNKPPPRAIERAELAAERTAVTRYRVENPDDPFASPTEPKPTEPPAAIPVEFNP